MEINLGGYNFKFDWRIAVAGAVLIILLAVGGFLYFKNQSAPNPNQSAQNQQEEVKKLTEEVGKLMELPSGETPTLATVADISQLQNQPFFQKAKNGDKVLIYSNAKLAILYDPKAKKIINVAPINVASSSAQQATPSASPAK